MYSVSRHDVYASATYSPDLLLRYLQKHKTAVVQTQVQVLRVLSGSANNKEIIIKIIIINFILPKNNLKWTDSVVYKKIKRHLLCETNKSHTVGRRSWLLLGIGLLPQAKGHHRATSLCQGVRLYTSLLSWVETSSVLYRLNKCIYLYIVGSGWGLGLDIKLWIIRA